MLKLFKRKSSNPTTTARVNNKPESLNEYLVFVGNGSITVQAPSATDAKRKALDIIKSEAPHYHSDLYTSSNPQRRDYYRTTLRGPVSSVKFVRTVC